MSNKDKPTYETRSLGGDRIDAIALEFVAKLHGFPVSVARLVLRRADFWIDATQEVDCGSSEFQRAVEALQAAFPESV